jgi:tetratricopeptide (TPR) repeat protein
MGRADEGIASLREAMRQDPSNHTLGLDLADLLADARRHGEAEVEYRRVLEGRPDEGRALTGLGGVFAATDRLDLALAQLNRALELDDRNEEARLERARVYSRLDRPGEARADFERLAKTAMRPDIRDAARRRVP